MFLAKPLFCAGVTVGFWFVEGTLVAEAMGCPVGAGQVAQEVLVQNELG
jgi:hypothetical protein